MSRHRRWAVFFCLAAAWAVFCPQARAQVDPARPQLLIETARGENEIRVETLLPDGSRRSTLLRSTAAGVVPGPAGSDPTGAAVFATWDESDSGRWFSYSRNGGATWSDARPLKTDLLLRDGITARDATAPQPSGEYVLPANGRLFLVQFRVIGLPEWRRALRDLGVELFQYFPYNTHLVRMDPARVAEVSQLEFVERVLPYHPAYRVEQELRDWSLSRARGRRDATRRVRIVALEAGPVSKARIARAAEEAGAKVAATWPSGHVMELELTREQLRRISAHDDLLWIDRWMAPEPDMDLVRIDTGTEFVESTLGYCGQGVRGEVLDAGIEETHQDFGTVLLHGSNSTSKHGTQVYGVLFGDGDRNGGGMAAATGQLPCAGQGISGDYDFMVDRFAHTQELLGPPYYASFQSNSWGNGLSTEYNSYSSDLDDIIWQLDIAIIQSQSNRGTQLSRPEAWSKNVISVGGIQHLDTLDTSDDTWGGVASIGPAEDGRFKPDLSHWNDFIYTTDWNNSYEEFGGTSSSTAQVAGVVGILLQMWSDNVWGTNPTGQTVFERKPHFSTIKALLINNAQYYDFFGQVDDLSRFKQGWGRPSARIALERAATSFIVDETIPLAVGEIAEFALVVAEGESELKLTMVFPDPPGTTSSIVHRINDVDLRLVAPDGTIYLGNEGLRLYPTSVAGGVADTKNTVENVILPDPEPGIWQAFVEATEVNQDGHLATPADDVAFALVATGATGALCTPISLDFTISPVSPTIGQTVQFNSNVSGGGGGPYSFEWDIDGDGIIDSTDANPTRVYEAYSSVDVVMNVRDANHCPAQKTKNVTVSGPSIVVDSVAFQLQIQGNGNGVMDPGETWAIRLQLANIGNQDAEEVSAVLAPVWGNPGGAAMLREFSEYGDIPAGGVAQGSSTYRVRIGQGFQCGGSLALSLNQIQSVTPEHTYPDDVAAVLYSIGSPTCSPYSLAGAGDVAELLLTYDEENDDIFFEWTEDCGAGTHYTFYRGNLWQRYTSATAAFCDLEELSLLVLDPGDAEFYFVAPSDGVFEGSYGIGDHQLPRPPLLQSCYPQDVFDACPN